MRLRMKRMGMGPRHQWIREPSPPVGYGGGARWGRELHLRQAAVEEAIERAPTMILGRWSWSLNTEQEVTAGASSMTHKRRIDWKAMLYNLNKTEQYANAQHHCRLPDHHCKLAFFPWKRTQLN